jgi:hypothetical protein
MFGGHMRNLSLFFFVFFSLSGHAIAEAIGQDHSAGLIPIEDFTSPAILKYPRLNPSGDKLVIGKLIGRSEELHIGNINTEGFEITHTIPVPEDVYRYRVSWADDERLIVQYIRYSGTLPTIDEEPSIEIFAVDQTF